MEAVKGNKVKSRKSKDVILEPLPPATVLDALDLTDLDLNPIPDRVTAPAPAVTASHDVIQDRIKSTPEAIPVQSVATPVPTKPEAEPNANDAKATVDNYNKQMAQSIIQQYKYYRSLQDSRFAQCQASTAHAPIFRKPVTRWQRFLSAFRKPTRGSELKRIAERNRRAERSLLFQNLNQGSNRPSLRFNYSNVESRKVKCSDLSAIPIEDPINGKEYTGECLWEMYFAMNEYLDMVYATNGLQRYRSRLNAKSTALEKITEVSKPIRRFRFYLLNLLGFSYNHDSLTKDQPRYKISGLENLPKAVSIAKDVIQELLEELCHFQIPKDFCHKLLRRLDDIQRTLETEEDAASAVAATPSQHAVQTVSASGFYQLPQTSLKNIVEAYTTNEKRTEFEEEIMVTCQGRFEAHLEKVFETETKKEGCAAAHRAVQEHVKLPYSWDELTQMINLDTETSPINDLKPKVSKDEGQKQCGDLKVTGISSSPQLFVPVDPDRLRKRWEQGKRLTLFRTESSSSSSTSSTSSASSSDSEHTPSPAPSTALQNVSAELANWTRRRAQPIRQLRNGILKLFKRK